MAFRISALITVVALCSPAPMLSSAFAAAPSPSALIAVDERASLQQVSQSYVAEGQGHFEAENFSGAQRSFERALVADPANITAMLMLGRSHDMQGRIGRSLKYFRQALELDPRNIHGLTLQAAAYLKRGLVDRAERNAARIEEICGAPCEPADTVRTAIKDHRQKMAMADSDGEKPGSQDPGL